MSILHTANDVRPPSHAWGARPAGPGTWDFAIWAPSAKALALHLPEGGRRIPLVRGPDGVHRVQAAAQEGCLYGYSCGGEPFADPASLQQHAGVEGWSVLRNPASFRSDAPSWAGRPFDEAVFCELHVGSFTRSGTFAAAARSSELRRLAEIGVTAIELMPVGQFPGQRGWGYDSVLPWAPQHCYGTPEALAALIDEAHRLGLMVFLDVVFNHFGPVGCTLNDLCPEFFQDEYNDWGRKIDYSRPEVRSYFIGCALHWLRAYDLDGLRLDAAHTMEDASDPHIVVELARTIRSQDWPHPVHLVAEDSSNRTGWYEPTAGLFDATWNDDYHHALHVALTGETFGYYKEFSRAPLDDLRLSLRDGQALQGQPRGPGLDTKGEPSAHLPPATFVNFNLNHDHAGNRPRGERLISLIGADKALMAHAFLLAAPYTPLLFMGEEIGSRRRFPWFADYTGATAQVMRDGRLEQFSDLPGGGSDMFDPFDPATHHLCWPYAAPGPVDGDLWLEVTRTLLALRRSELLPLFRSGRSAQAEIRVTGGCGLTAVWHFKAGSMRAALSFDGTAVDFGTPPDFRPLYGLGKAEAPHMSLAVRS